MKWLIVSSRWPPDGGGSEIIAGRVAELLRDSNEQVVIVSSAKPGGHEVRPPAEVEPQVSDWRGIRHIRYHSGNIGTIFDLQNFSLPRRVLWHLLDAANFPSAKIFRQILEKEKPDIVLTHNLKGLGYFLPRTAKKFGAKTIHTLHDVQLIEPSGIAEPEVSATVARRLWSNYTRALIGAPGAVIFPSEWLRGVSDRWGFFPHSLKRVIRNPVVLRPIPNTPHPIKTLLFLGQIEAHKGIPELLRAARRINKNYELLIVGEGRLLDLVKDEEQKNPRVKFLRKLQGESLADVWQRADLVIVPSICAENAPNVIQEAAAHGVPVIASRVGGIPELVREGETGALVPPGDAGALSAAISARLGTSVTELMRQAMTAVSESWSGENYLKELKALAQKL